MRYLWPFTALFFLCAIAWCLKTTPDPHITIGIFQSNSHPMLETCSQACIEKVKERLGEDISFISLNAENSLKIARSHARKLHNSSKVKAILTLGPLATKVMAQIETIKPLIFAAISESEMPTFSKQNTNIHGVESLIDHELIALTGKLIAPESKTATIIQGNNTTSNLRHSLKNRLERQGLTVTEVALTSKTNFTELTNTCLLNDIIFVDVPPGNNRDLFIPLVEQSFLSKRPFITTDPSLLNVGACASCSIDYIEIGSLTGNMLANTFTNQSFGEKIETLSTPKIIFNNTILQAWNLNLPLLDNKVIPLFVCKEYPQSLHDVIPHTQENS
ncbi:ABC transporter substrate-binding protein [Candidatus Clavichlamydia salmonicola]|uniref:ABC transporter substrate-binding protein n=1 Tax=Candidatus Clavichlamydia salmonicola TaxID=469812 RepID=UPI0018911DF5|nr:ABC transporter substrate binding protein [Candidatus Clavichlamydia salmonicola]